MRLRLIIVLAAALIMIPGFSEAQQHGSAQGQHKTKSSTMKGGMGIMRANMGLMAEITDKIQQMIRKNRMSPEQQEQVLGIMKQMSQMMQEMSVPHGQEVKRLHYEELLEMRKAADSLYQLVGN